MASDKTKLKDPVSIPLAFEETASGKSVLAASTPANDVSKLPSEEVLKRKAELMRGDSKSVIYFGSEAAQGLREISTSMLDGVRNKDLGPAGNSLKGMVSIIKGFSGKAESFSKKKSWLAKVFTDEAQKLEEFLRGYENVQTQVDKITEGLLTHEENLLTDIQSLDILYERTLEFYDELAVYIEAGALELEEVDNVVIPEAERQLKAAGEEQAIIKAQELSDLRAWRNDLDRRVHDLKLTRQVTMQTLPSIRLAQENDKTLVSKINSTLVNTVPLWQSQLAQAISINRAQQAADSVRSANDLTNELLKANAKNLRQANKTTREEVERGVFDIAAVREANENLIETIKESLTIADKGKVQRKQAEKELVQMEQRLRDTLASARNSKVLSGREASPARLNTPGPG